MSLIAGIDYIVEGVDYDTFNKNMIQNTFNNLQTRQTLEPLWHIIDIQIDRQARDNTYLFGDAEWIYETIEEFCKSKQITDIPPLYKRLFDARPGFMTQMKFPIIIRKEWMEYFIEPLVPKKLDECDIVKEFRDFVYTNQSDDNKYWSVLFDLEEFGFPYDFSDVDDEDEN
jgi:hypothetical protein